MPLPPLTGRLLHAARALANTRAGYAVIRKITERELGIRDLMQLPLPEVDQRSWREHQPLQARPPRAWADAGLEPPHPARASAATLRHAYASGSLRPSEVLDGLKQRLQRGEFGDAVNSPFIELDLEAAGEAARQSDARWAAGAPRGLLDGVPLPVKDEHDMVGLATRMGTGFPRPPAEVDGWLIRQLRDAGALLYGKTHLPEYGGTPMGHNPHHDLPRNAYDPRRGAGGSSTGSAVAVALGYGPAALGSDAGGSIRIPASLNGVFGLKPTFVRIGRTGNPLGLRSLAHLGPLGGGVEDLVDFLSVAATRPDPDDPPTAAAPDLGRAAEAWRAALGRGVRGCRVGVPEAEWQDADPGVAKLGRQALDALAREGAILVPVDLPLSRHGLAMLSMLLLEEADETMAHDIDPNVGALGLDMQLTIAISESVPPEVLAASHAGRAALRREWALALEPVDVIALPTTASTAPRLPGGRSRQAMADLGATRALCRFTAQSNLTGLPAGTAPVGLHRGLPVGLQIVGDAWDEASVIAVLAHVERLGLSRLSRPAGFRDLL